DKARHHAERAVELASRRLRVDVRARGDRRTDVGAFETTPDVADCILPGLQAGLGVPAGDEVLCLPPLRRVGGAPHARLAVRADLCQLMEIPRDELGCAVHGFAGRHAQAVLTAATPARPRSSISCSRMRNFCTLPVTVSGKASTKRMWRGTL